MNFDEGWRLESINIAAQEQLESWGELKLDVLFTRAKMIYDTGYNNMLDKWESERNEDLKRAPKPPEKPKQDAPVENRAITGKTKKCPVCDEDIPAGWPKHQYKKDGNPCGHTFLMEVK